MPVPYETVNVEDRTRLLELDTAREATSRRLLSLGLEVIDLLMVGRRLDGDEKALYRKIATERGIPETALIEVNPRNGELAVSLEPERPAPITSVPAPREEAPQD